MGQYGYPTNQYIAASAIITGSPTPTFVGPHPGFASVVANGVGDYSLFLAEELVETQCRVYIQDHVQQPNPVPDTVYNYSRPSATEINVRAADVAGAPQERDLDITVVGVLPP